MGADSFVMASFGGEYIIQDFDVNEGDNLDLRLLMRCPCDRRPLVIQE